MLQAGIYLAEYIYTILASYGLWINTNPFTLRPVRFSTPLKSKFINLNKFHPLILNGSAHRLGPSRSLEYLQFISSRSVFVYSFVRSVVSLVCGHSQPPNSLTHSLFLSQSSPDFIQIFIRYGLHAVFVVVPMQRESSRKTIKKQLPPLCRQKWRAWTSAISRKSGWIEKDKGFVVVFLCFPLVRPSRGTKKAVDTRIAESQMPFCLG